MEKAHRGRSGTGDNAEATVSAFNRACIVVGDNGGDGDNGDGLARIAAHDARGRRPCHVPALAPVLLVCRCLFSLARAQACREIAWLGPLRRICSAASASSPITHSIAPPSPSATASAPLSSLLPTLLASATPSYPASTLCLSFPAFSPHPPQP